MSVKKFCLQKTSEQMLFSPFIILHGLKMSYPYPHEMSADPK